MTKKIVIIALALAPLFAGHAAAQQQMPSAGVVVDVNIGGMMCGAVGVQADSHNQAGTVQNCDNNIAVFHQAGDVNEVLAIQNGATNNANVFQGALPGFE